MQLLSKNVYMIKNGARLFKKLALQTIQKIPKTNNEVKLQIGIAMKNQTLPRNIDYQPTVKQAGFVQHPVKTTAAQYSPHRSATTDDIFGRTARIFAENINHMQEVPTIPNGYAWTVQLARWGIWKQNATGWTYVADSFSRTSHKFDTLEQAIDYCKQYGMGYEVSYPKYRWHKRKSYAENFLWPGHDNAEDEDC